MPETLIDWPFPDLRALSGLARLYAGSDPCSARAVPFWKYSFGVQGIAGV